MPVRAVLALVLLVACGPSAQETHNAIDEAVKKQRAAEQRARMAEETAKAEGLAREKSEEIVRNQAKALEALTTKLEALETEQAGLAKKRGSVDEEQGLAKAEDERRRALDAERAELDKQMENKSRTGSGRKGRRRK